MLAPARFNLPCASNLLRGQKPLGLFAMPQLKLRKRRRGHHLSILGKVSPLVQGLVTIAKHQTDTLYSNAMGNTIASTLPQSEDSFEYLS